MTTYIKFFNRHLFLNLAMFTRNHTVLFINMTSLKKRFDKFIDDASKKHRNKYDYSLVEYINNKTKVKILCPIHDIFLQTPDSHLHGGCMKCGNISRGKKRAHTYVTAADAKNIFIDKAQKIHKQKYDYSKVFYSNNRTKVKILCLKHRFF